MKKIKISMIAVIAIVMGIAASAFTTNKMASSDKGPLAITWFQFMGTDPTDVSQVQDHLNYEYVDGTACTGNQLICAVQAQGDESPNAHPDEFSPALKSKLADAASDQSATYPEISREP